MLFLFRSIPKYFYKIFDILRPKRTTSLTYFIYITWSTKGAKNYPVMHYQTSGKKKNKMVKKA
jgi:hypothetical protein